MNSRNHATLLLGTSLFFWGWLTGWIYLAALPGGLMIFLSLTNKKMVFGSGVYQKAFYFSVLSGIVLGVWSMFIQKEEIYVMVLLRLSPLVWMPLALVMALDAETKVAPGVFFSGDLASAPATKSPGSPKENWFYWFFFACILATGAARDPHPWFFPGAVLFLAGVMGPWRVRQVGWSHWFILLAIATVAGYLLQTGLFSLQRSLMTNLPQYLGQWLYQSKEDFNHRHTDIGEVGQLKLSGRIMFRVHHEGPLSPPLLLRENTYDSYFDGGWSQTRSKYSLIPPASPVHTWVLDEKAKAENQARRVTMQQTVVNDQGLLLLPPNALRIEHLDVALLEKNRFGVLRYRDGAPAKPWTIVYTPKGTEYVQEGQFADTDLRIPGPEKMGIDQAFKEAGLEGQPHAQVIQKLHRYFLDRFSYSLDLADHSRFSTPVTAFLLGSKQGHCEYFATASALLLRRAGIPARYVFGYAVSEADSQKGWYLARQRDAHAWTSVFIDGQWRIEDFTPPDWRQLENENINGLQSLLDLFYTLTFKISQWIQGGSQETRLGM
ncbi:MAG TPA: hypothetical protein HPQ00_07995, partial [Magnetococcales bacterium]|nr:hypothetical protein [Magnetococcales bacterium]